MSELPNQSTDDDTPTTPIVPTPDNVVRGSINVTWTGWIARFTIASMKDGDEWDVAHEKLEADWLAEYAAAFVEIAVSRGWKLEDAETWPSQIGKEAYIHCDAYGYDPRHTAEADVIACEEE